MTKTIQTAVVGVTGYAGAELARLLLHHPRLKNHPPVFAGRVDAKDQAQLAGDDAHLRVCEVRHQMRERLRVERLVPAH